MNADDTIRLDISRPLPVQLARTLPAANYDETEHVLTASALIERLVDALMATYGFGAYEEQVVHHMLLGRSCHSIANRLGIRETTVHKHMHRVFARTKCEDRRGLYDHALRLAAVRSITKGSSWRMAA